MKIKPIKTRKFLPPKDNLFEVLLAYLPKLEENSVVAVASKIVSIGEGRCVEISKIKDKDKLIIQEAEKYLPREAVPGKWVMHTIKNNIFMPSAGIDESNASGFYILWPKNPELSAKMIWKFLRAKFGVKNLGVIITDSHSVPLRRGVIGISLAHCGFDPLRDYRGKEDIFGRKLVVSQANIPDGLAAAAVLMMGEGGEQTPIAVITGVQGIRFTKWRASASGIHSSFFVSPKEDMYRPFLYSAKWKKGKGGFLPSA